jgi:ankyrin repeat protein
MLIDNGADVTIQSHEEGITPLHLAVDSNNLTTVSILKKAGANPDIPDYDGLTPRMIATERNPIITLILDEDTASLLGDTF